RPPAGGAAPDGGAVDLRRGHAVLAVAVGAGGGVPLRPVLGPVPDRRLRPRPPPRPPAVVLLRGVPGAGRPDRVLRPPGTADAVKGRVLHSLRPTGRRRVGSGGDGRSHRRGLRGLRRL